MERPDDLDGRSDLARETADSALMERKSPSLMSAIGHRLGA
jgi:hypothetical protein